MNQTLNFIGHITTPYTQLDQCPNNVSANGPDCELVLNHELKAGLKGLNKGQNILVLYWFEGANRHLISQQSQSTHQAMGTFALRSPHRPNPIAAATVKIEGFLDNKILVKGLDCLSGTPLLDIKPA